MKKNKSAFYGLLLFLIYACGGDGENLKIDPDPGTETIDAQFAKVAAIAVDKGQIFQMDVNLNAETVQETNLTTSSGVEIPYQIFTSDTHVSFLYRQAPKYLFKTKQFDNTNVEGHENICGYETNNLEMTLTSTAVEDYLLVFTGSGDHLDELSVRSKHIATGNCQKISFGKGYDFDYNHILYDEDHIVVGFTNPSGEYTIAYIDLISGSATTASFDKYYSATIHDGLIHMLFNGQTGSEYELYDPKDWSLIENKTFTSYLNFGTNGLVQTQMHQSKVLIDSQYAQPGPQGNGPGIIDLNTGEFDLSSQVLSQLKTDLQNKYNANIDITSYQADLESETLVIGYQVKDFDGNTSGGLLISNFKGGLTKDLTLPYAPYAFEFVD